MVKSVAILTDYLVVRKVRKHCRTIFRSLVIIKTYCQSIVGNKTWEQIIWNNVNPFHYFSKYRLLFHKSVASSCIVYKSSHNYMKQWPHLQPQAGHNILLYTIMLFQSCIPHTIYHIPHTIYAIYHIQYMQYTTYNACNIPHTTYHIPHTIFHKQYTTYHIPHTMYHIQYTTFNIPHTTYNIPHTI